MKEHTTKLLSGEKALRFDVQTLSETQDFIKNNPFVETADKLSVAEMADIFGIGKKPEPFHNEELPEVFQNRTFIKNLSAFPYKLEEIPGHIVKYDEHKKDYIVLFH